VDLGCREGEHEKREGNMTDKELKKAIKEANEALCTLPSPSGPLPVSEVRYREMVLLRQLTLYKIEDTRKQDRKDLELLNIEIYGLITSFLESHEEGLKAC
jgi:hypothetical protein